MSGSPSAETVARMQGDPLARAGSIILRISSVRLIMCFPPWKLLLPFYPKFAISPSYTLDPKRDTRSGCSEESVRSSVSWRPAPHSPPSHPSDESAPEAASNNPRKRKSQSTPDRSLAFLGDPCKAFCQLHRRSSSTAGSPQRFLLSFRLLRSPGGGACRPR